MLCNTLRVSPFGRRPTPVRYMSATSSNLVVPQLPTLRPISACSKLKPRQSLPARCQATSESQHSEWSSPRSFLSAQRHTSFWLGHPR